MSWFRKNTNRELSPQLLLLSGDESAIAKVEEELLGNGNCLKVSLGVILVGPSSLRTSDWLSLIGEREKDLKILVVGLTGTWATRDLPKCAEWLRAHL
jgi:hypothetical protein